VSPRPEYPGPFLVKRITTGGTFRFGKRLVYLANALTNQQIGLEETDDGLWAIYFHTVLLATHDERDNIIQSDATCWRCSRSFTARRTMRRVCAGEAALPTGNRSPHAPK
jgi:hypothetical protein